MPSPLKDLYSSPNSLPVLSYPSDLGSSRKGHYVSFTIMAPQKANYLPKGDSGVASIVSPTQAQSGLMQTMNSIGNAATDAASSISSVTNTITNTIGSVASVANQGLTAVNTAVGAAAGVVGSVSGVAGIATSAIGQGSVLGGITAATAGVSVATNVVAGLGGTLDSVGQFISNPVDSISNAYDSVKSLLTSAEQTLEKTIDAFKGDNNPASTTFAPATTKIKGYINLYMPDTINMTQHANYADISATEALGNFGMGVEAGQQAITAGKNFGSIYSAAQESGQTPGETIRTMGSSAKEIFGGAAPLALEMGGNFVTDDLGLTGKGFSTYLLGKNNFAKNPQMEVMFTSIDFRVFQFDFTFTPKSPEEAASVREIIKMFRYHAAPEIDSAGSGRYFKVPSFFEIEYRHLENANENLHKFAACALTSVVVDYAPEAGWVAHNDGMPVKTRLTLQFKETEILTKDKITQGY